MNVSQLINDNGNPAANQFVIQADGHNIFKSYNTFIAWAEFGEGKVTLDTKALDYSRTTSKHLYIFLRDYTGHKSIQNRKDVERLIKSGVIKTEDLN